jgi:hypothetical protein
MSLMHPEEVCAYATENFLCQRGSIEALDEIPDGNRVHVTLDRRDTRTDVIIACGKLGCDIRRVVYFEKDGPEMLMPDPLSSSAIDGNCMGDPGQLLNLLSPNK